MSPGGWGDHQLNLVVDSCLLKGVAIPGPPFDGSTEPLAPSDQTNAPVPERQQVCHKSRSSILVLGSYLVKRVRSDPISKDYRDVTSLGQFNGT